MVADGTDSRHSQHDTNRQELAHLQSTRTQPGLTSPQIGQHQAYTPAHGAASPTYLSTPTPQQHHQYHCATNTQQQFTSQNLQSQYISPPQQPNFSSAQHFHQQPGHMQTTSYASPPYDTYQSPVWQQLQQQSTLQRHSLAQPTAFYHPAPTSPLTHMGYGHMQQTAQMQQAAQHGQPLNGQQTYHDTSLYAMQQTRGLGHWHDGIFYPLPPTSGPPRANTTTGSDGRPDAATSAPPPAAAQPSPPMRPNFTTSTVSASSTAPSAAPPEFTFDAIREWAQTLAAAQDDAAPAQNETEADQGAQHVEQVQPYIPRGGYTASQAAAKTTTPSETTKGTSGHAIVPQAPG